MKKYLIAIALSLLAFVVADMSKAANFNTASFLGAPSTVTTVTTTTTNTYYPGSVTFWPASTNTTTWYATNAYTTNIVVTNTLGVALYPNATNYVTGTSAGVSVTNTTYAGPWQAEVRNVADANGNANANASLSILFQGNSTMTNTSTLTFVRSADGVNFDLSLNTFAVTITPASTATNYVTVITNLPSVFVSGTRLIRLHSVAIGTNSVSTGALTLCNVSYNSFVP